MVYNYIWCYIIHFECQCLRVIAHMRLRTFYDAKTITNRFRIFRGSLSRDYRAHCLGFYRKNIYKNFFSLFTTRHCLFTNIVTTTITFHQKPSITSRFFVVGTFFFSLGVFRGIYFCLAFIFYSATVIFYYYHFLF